MDSTPTMILLLMLIFGVVHVTCALSSGSHWIVAPERYTPGIPVPLSFTFHNVCDDVFVQVDMISNDHTLVQSINHTFTRGQPEVIQLPVPSGDVFMGDYTLLINGFGGVYFQDHARLVYDSGEMPETFAVHIQTDKGIYKPGETVHFRTFGISSDMMVYTGFFNISIRDPKGNLMKHMINISETGYGIVGDSFILDTEPVLGKWELTVTARKTDAGIVTTKMKQFTVDKYVLPKFIVELDLPPFAVTSDKDLHGTVKAKYTYGKPVMGTVKLSADVDYAQAPWKYRGDEVMLETEFDISGEAKFTVPFSRITHEVDPDSFQPLVEKLAGNHLIITVSVTESLNNITRNVTSQVVFYSQPYKLSFDKSASMPYCKPGLPFVGSISLTQADGNPITSSKENVRLVSYVKYYNSKLYVYGARYLAEQTFLPPANGALEITVDVPVNITSLHLEVFYHGLSDTLDVYRPYWMFDSGNIHLSRNSPVLVGEKALFNVYRSKGMTDIGLFYAVIANDRVVQSGSEQDSTSDLVQISFQVTPQMKPYSKLIVYYFRTSMWNADALSFDVHEDGNKFRNKIALSFDRPTGEPGSNVSLSIKTDPMSLVNLLAVDQSVLLLANGNGVTQKDVISSLKVNSKADDGFYSQHDPKQILKMAGIQLITDVSSFDWVHPMYKRQIGCLSIPAPGVTYAPITIPTPAPGRTYAPGHYPTWVPGMVPTPAPGYTYAPEKIPIPGVLQEVTRTRNSFPETWLWTNLTIGRNGSASITTKIPDTITSWFATAFSVNKHTGLGLTDFAAKFTTFRPFFINLNLPYSVVRGEEVVIQANVFNYMGQDLDVVVTLEKSDDYQVINRAQSGHVTYSSMDFVQNVHIKAGMTGSVFVPVVARIVGVANIAVKAQTVLSADRVVRDLIIEAEGKTMHFNVPMILNENKGVDIPLSFPSTFVADSQKIQVSVIGDTMGPTVKNLKQLLRIPVGCGEQTMISLAPDVFVYNYLQKSNHLTPEIADMALQFMNQGYQRELTFQHNDGSFSVWGQSDYEGSMWLSAFVLKSFLKAKEHMYIENSILSRTAEWIISHQNSDGTFSPTGSISHTNLRGGTDSGDSLTGFVLISLLESQQTLQGIINKHMYNPYKYLTAVSNARNYLEQKVASDSITDLYDLAVISYALGLVGSPKAYVAFSRLDKMSITTPDGKKFWNVTSRGQLYSWQYSYYQSPPLEIEIASYALLYLTQIHQYSEGFPILKWLIGQRNSRGAFRSTQDTVLGLQAMSEYGAMFSDQLNLDVDISSANFHKQIHVDKADALVLKLVDIPLSSTHYGRGNNTITPMSVSLQGHGTGSVLAQVSVSFNVETEVSMPAFNITTVILSETFRSIIINSCAWYLPQRFESGSMCVMELDLPSGFAADLESPNTVLFGVRRSEIRDEKTLVLYYDQILPAYPGVCATIEMTRTDLVAKTKPAAVRVFDYYKPDNRALTFFESQLLKQSSYCDICSNCGCW